ncbi:hypothetical protein [Pseudoduganella violaceinigra]|uniref:hypothetical protein n=1 Tax=Pseudoduganella violaceinigra TaxID=246602 RepID=UPI00048312C1|nr:hypothetical protein [Pseudoduganella violaceinigra]
MVEESVPVVRSAARRANAIPVAARVETKALDYCLDVWMRWQRRDDTRLGWRGRSAILQSDYAEDVEGDSDELYEVMETRVAEGVEAMMQSLPRHLDWAIRRRCNIATVWRFPSLDFTDVVGEAERALEILLRKNIATRIYFD